MPCCLGTLRLCCGTWPSSVCFAATFPPGEGFFGGTTLTEPSPRGKVGRAKPGSDEGNLPQALRRVLTYPLPRSATKKTLDKSPGFVYDNCEKRCSRFSDGISNDNSKPGESRGRKAKGLPGTQPLSFPVRQPVTETTLPSSSLHAQRR